MRKTLAFFPFAFEWYYTVNSRRIARSRDRSIFPIMPYPFVALVGCIFIMIPFTMTFALEKFIFKIIICKDQRFTGLFIYGSYPTGIVIYFIFIILFKYSERLRFIFSYEIRKLISSSQSHKRRSAHKYAMKIIRMKPCNNKSRNSAGRTARNKMHICRFRKIDIILCFNIRYQFVNQEVAVFSVKIIVVIHTHISFRAVRH